MALTQHRAPRDWEVLTLYVPNMHGIPDYHRRIDSSLDASFYPLTCCTQVCQEREIEWRRVPRPTLRGECCC
jgi:hypothetical protein